MQETQNLVLQGAISGSDVPWHGKVLSDLADRLGRETGFPCLFSKNAFSRENIRFIFVDGTSPDDMAHLSRGLSQYVDLSRRWDGSINTAYPLIVAFSPAAICSESPERYDAFGWHVLQKLHELDPEPWPAGVGTDPDGETWSMCFKGMPLFCNMSHPAHRSRRSRNLGEHFLLVINPRERFDVVAGDTPGGRKVRANIRARIERYDGQSHCPQLASYGSGAEWWQYSVADENVERSDKCPFSFKPRGRGAPAPAAA